jgi:hypothetical protein
MFWVLINGIYIVNTESKILPNLKIICFCKPKQFKKYKNNIFTIALQNVFTMSKYTELLLKYVWNVSQMFLKFIEYEWNNWNYVTC